MTSQVEKYEVQNTKFRMSREMIGQSNSYFAGLLHPKSTPDGVYFDVFMVTTQFHISIRQE